MLIKQRHVALHHRGSHGTPPVGRLRRNEPGRWRSPAWPGRTACGSGSSAHNATYRTRRRPSCTARTAQRVRPDLQVQSIVIQYVRQLSKHRSERLSRRHDSMDTAGHDARTVPRDHQSVAPLGSSPQAT